MDDFTTDVEEATAAVQDLTDEYINFSEEGTEALTAAELSQARSYANIQAKADETAAKAEELADRTIAATDRINASWERFVTDQDASVKQMSENNISFGDLVEALAKRNGISTVAMAQQYAGLGVKYGDTLALIEAAGRETIDATLAELARLKKVVAGGVGGGGGRGYGDETSRFFGSGEGRAFAHRTAGGQTFINRAATPELAIAEFRANRNELVSNAREQTLSGTVTVTDGFDDVVGEAMVRITERGG